MNETIENVERTRKLWILDKTGLDRIIIHHRHQYNMQSCESAALLKRLTMLNCDSLVKRFPTPPTLSCFNEISSLSVLIVIPASKRIKTQTISVTSHHNHEKVLMLKKSFLSLNHSDSTQNLSCVTKYFTNFYLLSSCFSSPAKWRKKGKKKSFSPSRRYLPLMRVPHMFEAGGVPLWTLVNLMAIWAPEKQESTHMKVLRKYGRRKEDQYGETRKSCLTFFTTGET